jgi:chromosome segregation ATPase
VQVSDLDAIAQELDQRALQVASASAQLVRAAAEALWTSTAADAFRARVGRRDAECLRLAAELRGAARTVSHYSDDVSAEKARLRRLELEAEQLAVRLAVGVPVHAAGDVAKAAHTVASWARL